MIESCVLEVVNQIRLDWRHFSRLLDDRELCTRGGQPDQTGLFGGISLGC